MAEKILITSALPYANGPLHFGHIAGAYLPGDCYARFQRLMGNDVLYICGSDEHGVAITLSAELAKRTAKEHVDLFHKINKDFFDRLGFSFDHYSRTTWPGHVPTTQEFYEALRRKGVIEERTENHLYSEQEGRFLADRYVVGTCPKCGYEEARGDECQRCASSYEATDLKNPRSKLTGSSLTLKLSTHLYLRFDKFKGQLTEWIGKKHWKENVIHFAMQYINDLKPRAITRDSDWGIPVPGYPGKVFYVWFDAPIGYVSATKEWAEKIGKPHRWEDYWFDPKCKLVHFIGKDNIPFHAVFFPAMLMGQDRPYKLPDEIPANEFYMLEGRQFSKSEGWYIDLQEFFSRYTADQARYVIAANAPETSDSAFSWKDFQMRCNAELLGKFGNFVNRVLVFAKQHCGSKVPKMGKHDFIKEMSNIVD
ncbi:MAG: methionine--tRNA ligase, partial [Minisyncoccia bacterium]